MKKNWNAPEIDATASLYGSARLRAVTLTPRRGCTRSALVIVPSIAPAPGAMFTTGYRSDSMLMSSLCGDACEGSLTSRKGYIVSSEEAGGGGRPMIGSPKK